MEKSSAYEYSRNGLIDYPAAKQDAKRLSYPFVSVQKEVCTGRSITIGHGFKDFSIAMPVRRKLSLLSFFAHALFRPLGLNNPMI